MGLHFLGVLPDRPAVPARPASRAAASRRRCRAPMSWGSPSPSAGRPASGRCSARSSASPHRAKRSARGACCSAVYSLGLAVPSGSPPASPAPSCAFLMRFRRHLGTVESIMGGLLVLTGLAFMFGYISSHGDLVPADLPNPDADRLRRAGSASRRGARAFFPSTAPCRCRLALQAMRKANRSSGHRRARPWRKSTGLVLPFFGMILLGYVAAKDHASAGRGAGLAQHLHHLHRLPALFFKIIARTPIEQLARVDFILANVSATYLVFALIFASRPRVQARPRSAEATMQGLAAAYGNHRLHGARAGAAGLRRTGRGAGGARLLLREHAALHGHAGADVVFRRRPRGATPQSSAMWPAASSPTPSSCPRRWASSQPISHFEPPAPAQRLIDYLAQAAAPARSSPWA